jgi:undecaprenyl diphosphate synthase
MMSKELEVNVYGRVQGVRFRGNVKGFAVQNKICGFVENKEDGSVNILAQGNEKGLRRFLDWINKSPGLSKIEKLDCRWRDIGKEYSGFEIARKDSYVVDQARSLMNLGRQVVSGSRVVPAHICLIPDGNRRWAKTRGFGASFGHYKSGAYDNLEELFKEARNMGVKYVSIWGFSSENWKRSDGEVKDIFDLILKGVGKFRVDAGRNKIRFRHIGRKDRMPRELSNALKDLEKETSGFEDFNVQLFLDYGGRDEIVRAVNKVLKSGKQKVDELSFSQFLDTSGIPEPDMIIRTSGEHRTSGLMPYHGAYAELYFSDLMFPDFGAAHLREAVEEYSRRQRRFGK